jgi:threonine synthase
LTPLVQAPRLADALGVRELWLKLDTANPTHSFKYRVVAVACAKAQ